MIGQPPSSALYKREHRWSPEGILQQRVEVIQHVADATHPVGLRTEWRDVYVGEEIVLRYEESPSSKVPPEVRKPRGKDLPGYLPPLPKSGVYLGTGGTFEVPYGKFRGWASRGLEWAPLNACGGDQPDLHYAAAENEEIVRVNWSPVFSRPDFDLLLEELTESVQDARTGKYGWDTVRWRLQNFLEKIKF